MSDGDLSALFTLLAVPAGGLIAWGIFELILWLHDRAEKRRQP